MLKQITVYPEKLVLDFYELADFSRGSKNRENWLPALDSLRTLRFVLPRVATQRVAVG